MPIVRAELIVDAVDGPVRSWSDQGMRGRRCYRVATADESLVDEALGLPIVGEVWSERFPLLAMVNADARFEGGTYHKVYVNYETPLSGGGGRLEPRPAPNLAYTERSYSEQTVNVQHGVGGASNHAIDLPIAAGDGAPKTVIGTRLKVVIWRDIADYSSADDIGLENLQGCIVENTLELPPLYGTNVPLRYRPEHLLYLFSEARGEAGLVRIEHNFEAKASHLVYWWSRDIKGRAIPPVKKTQIYDPVNFPQSALR